MSKKTLSVTISKNIVIKLNSATSTFRKKMENSFRQDETDSKTVKPKNHREKGSLSYCNWTRTHDHLVHKQTLNSTL